MYNTPTSVPDVPVAASDATCTDMRYMQIIQLYQTNREHYVMIMLRHQAYQNVTDNTTITHYSNVTSQLCHISK